MMGDLERSKVKVTPAVKLGKKVIFHIFCARVTKLYRIILDGSLMDISQGNFRSRSRSKVKKT